MVCFAILLPVIAATAFSQTNRQQNLQTCLTGRYPALCDHTLLTAEELKLVSEAERRENLKTCMTGKYPALCDHSKLTPGELKAVREAERQENLRICLTGRFPSLCNHSLLSPAEGHQVRAAEKAENLKVCLDGRFPALCNEALLSSEQANDVRAAEAKAITERPPKFAGRLRTARPAGAGCDSGHWIESLAGDGKILKLEDGSLWMVDDVDTVTSSIWLPASEVVVCGSKIINVDDGESVEATPLLDSMPRPPLSSGRSTYVIQASSNDETFVINGEVFKAKTYCFNMEKGDKVMFLSGSPNGACVSAELLNLRTDRVCRVWCE